MYRGQRDLNRHTARHFVDRGLQGLTAFFTYACYFGLFVLIAGYFLTNQDTRFHTQMYLGLNLPVAILLVLAIKPLYRDWSSDPALL